VFFNLRFLFRFTIYQFDNSLAANILCKRALSSGIFFIFVRLIYVRNIGDNVSYIVSILPNVACWECILQNRKLIIVNRKIQIIINRSITEIFDDFIKRDSGHSKPSL